MNIIDGKKIAEAVLEKLKEQPKPEKFLAAVLVGDDSASKSFIKQKEKAAKELGVDFRVHNFSAVISQNELCDEVRKISEQADCGGILVQLPLPEHIDKQTILNIIPKELDIDVLSESALGAFYENKNSILPPSAAALEEILGSIEFSLPTAKVAVVGLGFLVGKPISVWLEGKVKELILLDKGSDFLILREADLVITGVGSAGIIKPDMLKNEAVVVDFGYADGKGDFDPEGSQIIHTPTPGGTGPVLVIKLLENFYKLNS